MVSPQMIMALLMVILQAPTEAVISEPRETAKSALIAAVIKEEKSDQSHVNSGANNKTLENLTQQVGLMTTVNYDECKKGRLDAAAKSCLCSTTLGNTCLDEFCCVAGTGCKNCPSGVSKEWHMVKCLNTGGWMCNAAPPTPAPAPTSWWWR
jgi:hypothetical protein